MPGVSVKGLRELNAAFAHADRQTRLGVRATLREVAEPVRRTAEGLAVETIPRMASSPAWAKMRIGTTRSLVYVAPKRHRVKGRGGSRRRPNLAALLMGRAMEPALSRNATAVESGLERALDKIADDFNHAGGLLP